MTEHALQTAAVTLPAIAATATMWLVVSGYRSRWGTLAGASIGLTTAAIYAAILTGAYGLLAIAALLSFFSIAALRAAERS